MSVGAVILHAVFESVAIIFVGYEFVMQLHTPFNVPNLLVNCLT